VLASQLLRAPTEESPRARKIRWAPVLRVQELHAGQASVFTRNKNYAVGLPHTDEVIITDYT